ncbi:MAG: sigma-70 family RNA polymerase sigma factor [Phenylobacterium sp.]|nr:MAG: sigma-70 family RNA polymerase sigma factor [Phenylobacterium sp.]
MERQGRSTLVDLYFERRAELVRFFTLRLRSAAAAEDLVQDIYVRLASAEVDAEVRNPVSYLYRLGSNLMLDRLRGERRSAARDAAWRQTHRTELGGAEVAEEPDAVQAMAARQRLAAVVTAIAALSPQTQRVFRMHKFEGLSHSEVAAALGISRSAVEKHMIAALRHLSETLP